FTLASAKLGRLLSTQTEENLPVSIGPLPDLTRGRSPILIWSKRSPRSVALLFYHQIVQAARKRRSSGDSALAMLLRSSGIERASDIEGSSGVRKREAKEGRASPILVDACLALGFLAAIHDDWKQAEIYADMASRWSRDLDPTPRHEAYYLR